jgi:hypothetical protein
MNVTRKDASIQNVGADDDFPGSFEVVLSTAAKDRDGEELEVEDWKQPLPVHITFDVDHGMSVEKTVGSGAPSIEDGKLIVRGTYSSLPRAQEVRTLVKEGHIRTTSVAFMSEKVSKGGKTRTVRELLNGAFVAIPSNREAVVLSAKAGARNSRTDAQHLQAAHDELVQAGAACGPMDDMGGRVALESDSSGATEGTPGGKGTEYLRQVAQTKAKYSAEQLRQMLSNGSAMRGPDGSPSYPIGDKEDLTNAIHAVGRGGAGHDKIRAYIIRRARALGASDQIPDNWGSSGAMKDADDVETKDAADLAQGVDAALDEAINLLRGVDQSTLPEPVAQALGLVTAASETVDELLDAMGVDNPDEPTEETTPPAEKSADADALNLQYQAMSIELAAYTAD